jgi:hypothetical protein
MRVAMKQVYVLACAAVCGPLGGCSSWSSPSVPAAIVSVGPYETMDCAALKVEKARITSAQARLAPTLIPVVDEGKRESQLSELSGEAQAVEKVSIDHKCAGAGQFQGLPAPGQLQTPQASSQSQPAN